ncbi:MAG: bifunctional alpha,alpha-trehalose-phosphate synthase (UDP-forming)/trehalose-phosphatase [Eubacteriales bacterium]|nr:bifunctional alpha,alpha-trehalose-phosphate synthase (UDP-forming)/trehalose-phosphatase [Eubacteriales bacterium]MDD3198799.1 bifunctional alpha,alpha-trehalose-phosphate synthase (UDP-forming)/trehalose-phosphatase [Eubacteriales bacterium]MDD4629749.1 bifunctional alpha,alpha-trehalose-phosphate synthase (UDP-forming)/trehalose-phosphatase [Eubacteriales bacterium]
MSKLIIISNRLPITIKKNGDRLQYQKSIGGLVTGLKRYHEKAGSLWAGWTGMADDDISDIDKDTIKNELHKTYQYLPVFLTNEEVNLYYNGFSNKTIWPLFHYFTGKVQYEPETWQAYRHVNEKFFKAVEPVIESDDIIWVHDYQLMLLPQMIKERFPDTQVGFFLHIPFPSFEIFRLLIWRNEILKGLLGADLIGFHTYDYVRHFLSATRHLLDLESNMNRISYEDRYVQVDAFPMGISYDFFATERKNDPFEEEVRDIIDKADGIKMIVSIDRLDYSKGIPERLRSFNRFLTMYPEYLEKVRLNLIVAPSRVDVDYYEEIRREINELVSSINGKFGTFTWMPVWFFFRSFSQESLITLYRHSDVLLVTALRDGMNLVCKEYIAARTDYGGMVVISETTGAASELGEAVIVNANDYDGVACGIKAALDMTDAEKIARNKIMSRRIQRYDVKFWASEFLNSLQNTFMYSERSITQRSLEKAKLIVESAYKDANKRVLFLDYDGTLVGFKAKPEQAKPDAELKQLLINLIEDPKNTVVLISGRDRYTLEEWFGDLDIHIFSSHGLWIRHPGQDWIMTVPIDNNWKDSVRHILELYTDRTPGSFIEEKEYSLAWHYRLSDPDLIKVKLIEVKETLMSMTQQGTLGLLEGNKVLEVKDNRVNKGYTASSFISDKGYDFMFAAGDDYTDEDMFSALPENTFTVRVGLGYTGARYFLKSWQSMRSVLENFIDLSQTDIYD